MRYIIDRFEQDLAICETEEQEMISISRHLLPSEAAEGDSLLYERNTYRIDTAATNVRRKQMQKKLSDLFE